MKKVVLLRYLFVIFMHWTYNTLSFIDYKKRSEKGTIFEDNKHPSFLHRMGAEKGEVDSAYFCLTIAISLLLLHGNDRDLKLANLCL